MANSHNGFTLVNTMSTNLNLSEKSEKPTKPIVIFPGIKKGANFDQLNNITSISKNVYPVSKNLRFKLADTKNSFIAFVLIPVLIISAYLFVIANDQYSSTASFAVRASTDTPSAGDILGIFQRSGNSSTKSDTYILMDYLHGDEMIFHVDEQVNLDSVYKMRGLDFFYSLSSNLPIESKRNFWKSVVSANYNPNTEIVEIEVKAFNPNDAKKITDILVKKSSSLINNLSSKIQKDSISLAEMGLAKSEIKLKQVQKQLRTLRENTQTINPQQVLSLDANLLATLQSELIKVEGEIAILKGKVSNESYPLRQRIEKLDVLKKQILAEKSKLGIGQEKNSDSFINKEPNSTLAGLTGVFEDLLIEKEFAEKSYIASLASLESAKLEAQKQQRYLAIFQRPIPAQSAEYPRRYIIVISSLIIFSILWGIARLVYANLTSRR